jgi:hypothetical protein
MGKINFNVNFNFNFNLKSNALEKNNAKRRILYTHTQTSKTN